jgi:hypothetical protein
MPTSSGPNQKGEENLVFAYDVGDVKNSYRGEPTVNYETLQADPVNLTGFNWGWTTQSVGWYHGKYCLKCRVVSAGNNPNWTGAYSGISLPTTAGQVYTRSCELLVEPGGDHAWTPNVNATHGGTGGINAYYDMNNKGTWQKLQAYVTATGSSTPFYYYWFARGANDPQNVDFTVYMYHPQLENKSYATAFTATSRSTTEGLIDLTGNSSIDLSNVSFDLNAQMLFDGTNDYVNMGDLPIIKLGTNFTIEAVVKPEQDKWMYFFHKGYGQNNSLAWGRHSSGDNWFFSTMINGSYQNSYMGTATLNQYCHLAASYDGANLRLYENGDLQATVATTHDMMTSTQPLGIGGPDRYWNGEIPVTKVYNKALTAQEVKQNYQQYKTRFNLS